MLHRTLATLLLVLASCSKGDADASRPEDAKAAAKPEGAAGAEGEGEAEGLAAGDGSLLHRSCQHEVELGATLDESILGQPTPKERLARKLQECLAEGERTRNEDAIDEATFNRYLQCRLDASKFEEAMSCSRILIEAETAKVKGQLGGMMGDAKASGDAALDQIRTQVEAGVISAETLASIERDRELAGMGRFGSVLADANAQIVAGRVKPGTTMEIVIHPGLGNQPDGPARGEEAADLAFTDAESGHRVARISPIGGTALTLDIFSQRIEALWAWWMADSEGRELEIGLEAEGDELVPEMPVRLKSMVPMLQDTGLADRPLLVLPDGSRKSAKEWSGG
ncbi:MAG: hypothetical protein H6712_23000 [Myxococcales bacterium]|nr:hypothetical protein [Myxococcales bacterium]